MSSEMAYCAIHRIVTSYPVDSVTSYPVDSVIHLLNNWGQKEKKIRNQKSEEAALSVI